MEKLIIRINNDPKVVEFIDKKLEENNGICPCALLGNDATPQEREKYRCMCEPFRNQEIEGPCHCGKFVKVKVFFDISLDNKKKK